MRARGHSLSKCAPIPWRRASIWDGHVELTLFSTITGDRMPSSLPSTDPSLTRLKHAVATGDASTALALLAAGADANHADAHGATLLIHAAARGYAEVCRCLLEHGADVHRLDRFGRDAVAYARGGGHLDVVRSIESFNAAEILKLDEFVEPKQAFRRLSVAGTARVSVRLEESCRALPDRVIDPEQLGEVRSILEDMGNRIEETSPNAQTGDDQSADLPPEIDDEREQILSDLLRQVVEIAPEQAQPNEELHIVCEELLNTLTPFEANLLRARTGMDGAKEESLEEISRRSGVSVERLRQCEAKALRKLRHPARSEKLRSFLDDR